MNITLKPLYDFANNLTVNPSHPDADSDSATTTAQSKKEYPSKLVPQELSYLFILTHHARITTHHSTNSPTALRPKHSTLIIRTYLLSPLSLPLLRRTRLLLPTQTWPQRHRNPILQPHRLLHKPHLLHPLRNLWQRARHSQSTLLTPPIARL